MSKVRKKKVKGGTERKKRGLTVQIARREYVPSTSEPKQKGGGRWVGCGGVGQEGWDRMGWAKGRKRQDEEGKRIRLRQ